LVFGSYHDYRFYRILGVAIAAGAEANAEAPGSVISCEFWSISKQNLSLKCDYSPDYFLLGEMSVFIADLATNGELHSCPVAGGILQNPEIPFHEKTCNILHKPIYDP
jgi:hypothetical protein